MNFNLATSKSPNIKQIFDIYKFELFLQKNRFIIVILLSTAMIIMSSLLALSAPTAILFCAATLSQVGAFTLLFTLFFTGGIIANEFDKKTALTNFTKTGRGNFFIGKVFAAISSVLAWIGPAVVVTAVISLIRFGTIPFELIVWFGYYCLAGASVTSIFLLCSAIFRSGGQAMMIGFLIITASAISFAILLVVLNFPYPSLIYLEMVGQSILVGDISLLGANVDFLIGVLVATLYLIPCLILSYWRFKTRDV